MSSVPEFGSLTFDLPKNQSNAIKVIGVGGGGSNAINHMFRQGIKGVDFVVCNTDAQALNNSPVPIKIQLGVNLTEGMGAGANPNVGEQAAMESLEEIKQLLDTNTKMIFITAGMGGGTGTGAAPVIAKVAKDLGILSVGIITIPFGFEGRVRNDQAFVGVENLRKQVDSLIVVNNNKLREVYGNLGFKAGFAKADEVLATAARGIAEVITHHYTQNIDLKDARTVLASSGTAIMGSAQESGENRAQNAILKALDSPLLNDNKIAGAKNVLLLIVSGKEEITLDEIGEINDHIQFEAGHGAHIIMGIGEDDTLEDAIAVTIIATGFPSDQQHEIINTEAKKIIHTLEEEQAAIQDLSPNKGIKNVSASGDNDILQWTLDTEESDAVDELITDEIINNIEVVAEIIHPIREGHNDFVITSVSKDIFQMEVIDAVLVRPEEPQYILEFDLPLKKKPQPSEHNIIHTLDDEIGQIDVRDPLEIIPITDFNEDGEIHYSMDDYMEEENRLLNAKPPQKTGLHEIELKVEKKEMDLEVDEEVDPINNSIEEALRARAEERKRKLKEYNHKFHNSIARIDEIERQPAYKRAGIKLDDEPSKELLSRTSVSKNSNDELQLRTNNSFLHDNVD